MKCFFATASTGARCKMNGLYKRHMGEDVCIVCRRHLSCPLRLKKQPITNAEACEILKKKPRSSKAKMKSKFVGKPIMQRYSERSQLQLDDTLIPIAYRAMPIAGVVSTRNLDDVNLMKAFVVPNASQQLKVTKKSPIYNQKFKAQNIKFAPKNTRSVRSSALAPFPTFN